MRLNVIVSVDKRLGWASAVILTLNGDYHTARQFRMQLRYLYTIFFPCRILIRRVISPSMDSTIVAL
jgi:hypothetical protein